MIVRNEKETDHRHVEELIRKAFYNLYVPGCTEHYLARVMRGHEDFIPELDLVLELDGRVIGSILYTKAKLSDAAGKEKEILTFGPVCIAPEYQRMGYGSLWKRLLKKRPRWAMTLLLFSAARRTMWPEALKAAKSSTSARITDVTPRPCW